MFFEYELLILLAMIGTLLLLNLAFKLPTSIAMVAAAVVGALLGGEGIPLRHLFEGGFAFIDTAMIISTAMIFMYAVRASGTLEAFGAFLVRHFHKRPMLLLMLLMFALIFPGMLTGTAAVSVLCAGAIVIPVLELMGYSAVQSATFVAVGATLGMAAPPVNISAMLIASSVDMTYSGFTGPLLFITLVPAFIYTLIVGIRKAKPVDIEEAKKKIDFSTGEKYGFKIYIPILFVVLLTAAVRIFPRIVPDLGMPLVFTLGTLISLFTGRKFNLLETASLAMHDNVTVLGKIMAVGMFLQIFILVGVRGYIVTNFVVLPKSVLILVVVILMPVFAGISVIGSATLFGPPLILAMLSGNQIVMASALSMLAILGEMMPPMALCSNYAAKVANVNYGGILKRSPLPIVLTLLMCLVCLLFSNQLGFLTALG